VQTASSAYPGVVNVEGILNYNLYNPDPNTVFAATASRDVLVQALTNNATAVLAPMVATKNCDCLGPNVAPTINQPTAYSYASPNGRNITSMANALCAARLAYAGTDPSVVIGVNNGLANIADKFKYCSNPAIVGGTTGTPGTSPCVVYGVTNAYSSAAVAGTITVASAQLSSVVVTSGGAGYTSSQQTPIALTVSAGKQGETATAPCKLGTISGAAGAWTFPLAAGAGQNACKFTQGDAYNQAASPTFNLVKTAGSVYYSGCTFNDPSSIISANTGTGTPGELCNSNDCLVGKAVTCTTATGALTAGDPVDFSIDTTASKVVSIPPASTAPTVTPVIQGGQITALPVTTAGAAYGAVTLPALPAPASSSTGQLCTNAGNIAGADPTKFILQATNAAPTETGTCRYIGADSGAQRACGTPVPPGGVLGVPGKGSCSVQNAWIPQCNGGMNSCPSSTTYTCGVLPQSFITNRGPAPPAPAPAPTPTPAKAPTPTPTPTPTPSPSPLVCTYRGTYEIRPLYGPCDKYYLASGTKSNCAENFVHLRTKSNLGGKYDRIRWALAASAANGLGQPTRVVAEARAGVGACTNRNLAAPTDPTRGLKVGGSSWQWQFVPYPGSSKCDTVNMISQNRLSTTAFLSVPRTCKTFAYNATDGGRQRFRLTKA